MMAVEECLSTPYIVPAEAKITGTVAAIRAPGATAAPAGRSRRTTGGCAASGERLGSTPVGPLAHPVEQGTFNPKVQGSRPWRPTPQPPAPSRSQSGPAPRIHLIASCAIPEGNSAFKFVSYGWPVKDIRRRNFTRE